MFALFVSACNATYESEIPVCVITQEPQRADIYENQQVYPDEDTTITSEGETNITSEEETDMAIEQSTIRLITPSQAMEKMQQNPMAIILDVRTQEEYDEIRIPGAILLPDFEVEARAAEVLTNKDALILVHCRSGRRSQLTVKLLLSMGYTNVYDFGGIMSWPYETEQ